MVPTPALTLVPTLVSSQVPALVSILVPTPDPTLVLITKNVLSQGPILVPYFYRLAQSLLCYNKVRMSCEMNPRQLNVV